MSRIIILISMLCGCIIHRAFDKEEWLILVCAIWLFIINILGAVGWWNYGG